MLVHLNDPRNCCAASWCPFSVIIIIIFFILGSELELVQLRLGEKIMSLDFRLVQFTAENTNMAYKFLIIAKHIRRSRESFK